MIVAGCDIGALTSEAVVMQDGGVLGTEIIRSLPDSVLSATTVMGNLLDRLGLSYEDIDRCVSTGYGRDIVPFAQANISEVSCHGKGAVWLVPSIRTIIDGGGQDYKILRVDESGNLKSFRMTGKCAAGTGRALELMSESMGVEVWELGELAIRSTSPLPFKPACPLQTGISVRKMLLEGLPAEDIAAGIIKNVLHYLKVLTTRFDIEKDITITGGVAKNIGIVEFLRRDLKMDFVELPLDPQLMGALGAALFAEQQLLDPNSVYFSLPPKTWQ